MSFAGAQGYAAGDFGTLLSTADGGATWTGLPAGTFTGLYEVQAIDADSMFAARRGPPRRWRGRARTSSIRCATVQLCVMTTDRGDQLVRTADGGATATLVNRSRSWPARPGCGARPTAATRSTPCAARRSPGRASRRSTAPGPRSSPRA
jgi:hypothetical protein